MTNKNMYTIEQDGIRAADKILIGICAAIIPLVLTLYGVYREINSNGVIWINACIILVIPTLFTLLWHFVRWPVRLHSMRQSIEEACKILSIDLIKILEDVAEPKMYSSIWGIKGEKIIKGPDGKEYLAGRKEEIENKMIETLISVMSPDNSLIANTVNAHSRKIYDAQRHALIGALDERFARIKQVIDFISRKTRHWFFLFMIVSAIIGLIQMR